MSGSLVNKHTHTHTNYINNNFL